MLISFSKGRGKPDTLSCLRADGSRTWKQLHPGLVYHDLLHYVVESELGLRESFFGLLAQGHSIMDYELPAAERSFEVTAQALITEQLVALLQLEIAGQGQDADPIKTLRASCHASGIELPLEITPKRVDALRAAGRELTGRWKALEPKQVLELPFPD
ncbi:MAG: hypothetical protein ACI9HE_003057 [Planctomycetota bacterium]|jgi:hypothetical protein